jgi:hypothetical protein
MEPVKRYENFPAWIVLVTNLFSLMVYCLGLFIMYRLGWPAALLYLVYVLVLEFRIVKLHCINCVYWGQMCGFGKGKISSIFFKKGDVSKFCSKPMTWKNMIPDFLVSLIPILTGIVLMFINFNILILAAILGLVILTTIGNGYIRGSLTCKYCKQRDIGCPADTLFSKKE